jgi:hypothetical protein
MPAHTKGVGDIEEHAMLLISKGLRLAAGRSASSTHTLVVDDIELKKHYVGQVYNYCKKWHLHCGFPCAGSFWVSALFIVLLAWLCIFTHYILAQLHYVVLPVPIMGL